MGNEILTSEFLTVFNHAKDIGWWDGVPRYHRVNRNIVAQCQANAMKELLLALFSDGIGFDMGGPGWKFPDGRKVHGLDYVYKNAHDIQADILNLPFKDNSIDFIASFHALEHLDDIEKGISEFIRVIKHNGIIFSIIPDKRYFLHDNANPNLLKGMAAPCEIVPDEMLQILKKFNNIKILLFDTHQNNFDFNFLLRKI